MSNYHTKALANADIFTIMGSIYAEVARYDSAIASRQSEQSMQAVKRADELIVYAQSLNQINKAQKLEIKKFAEVFKNRVKNCKKSELDNYLLPFAITARTRQTK
jgi:ribosomal protein L33